MAIEVSDLSTLDPAAVAANLALVTDLVQAENADVDVKRGPFQDLVLNFASILATANLVNLHRGRQANSLDAILNDPTLVDTGIVDGVLSNWRVTASEGTNATGSITIVLDTAVSVSIAAGEIFTVNSIEFESDETFTSKLPPESVIEDTDKLLVELIDGTFAFTITATAVAVGTSGNIPRGTLLTITNEPVNFVKAYASSDFSGGTDADTNEELIDKLAQGVGIKALSNRVTYESAIRIIEGFEEIDALSIIGFGDEEMLRDAHSLWAGHFGGKVDVYSRIQPEVARRFDTFTATLVSKVGALGTWQFSIGKDDFPAYYDITKITLEGAIDIDPTFDITSEIRDFDDTGDGFIPDITTVVESAYTRYQTATVQFEDSITDATSLTVGVATQDYDVEVRLMPSIDTLQDSLVERTVIEPATDVLVRAPVPCFVETDIEIEYDSAGDIPDEDAIKQAVVDGVHSIDFGGRLPDSVIAEKVLPTLPSRAVIASLSITGTIREADGTETAIGPATVLEVPDSPDTETTGRTVIFFQELSGVDVTLTSVDLPPI